METTDTARVRADVLRVLGRVLLDEDVDPRQDFFAAGGSSLTALQALFQIEQQTHVQVSLTDFVECDDMGQFADLVAARTAARGRGPA